MLSGGSSPRYRNNLGLHARGDKVLLCMHLFMYVVSTLCIYMPCAEIKVCACMFVFVYVCMHKIFGLQAPGGQRASIITVCHVSMHTHLQTRCKHGSSNIGSLHTQHTYTAYIHSVRVEDIFACRHT
jgi:hypothetical protein